MALFSSRYNLFISNLTWKKSILKGARSKDANHSYPYFLSAVQSQIINFQCAPTFAIPLK